MEDESSMGEQASNAGGEAIAKIKEFGVVKIVAILVIVLFIFWFAFVRAAPAKITLSFVEQDSNTEISGVIVEATVNGEKAKACILPFVLCQDASSFTSSGSRVEMTLPGEDVSISILPPPKYAKQTITMHVQGPQSQTIELSKKTSATLSGPQSVTVGSECTQHLQFVVKNTGSDALTGDFVVDPAEKASLFTFPKVNAQPDSEQQIIVDVRGLKEKEDFDSTLRIKGTSISSSLSVHTVEKSTLQISPTSYSCSQYPCFIQISVRNIGQVRAEDLKVEFSPEIADVAVVSALDRTTVEPSEELTFGVQIADTQSAFGKITISSQCPPRTDIGVVLQHPT